MSKVEMKTIFKEALQADSKSVPDIILDDNESIDTISFEGKSMPIEEIYSTFQKTFS